MKTSQQISKVPKMCSRPTKINIGTSQQIYVKPILVLPLCKTHFSATIENALMYSSLGLGPTMLEFKPTTLKFKTPKPYLNQGL